MILKVVTAIALAGIGSLAASAEPAKTAEAQRQAVLRLTNDFRKSQSLRPLKENPLLDQAAQKHAENMARQEKCEHVLDGKGPTERIRATGYKIAAWGENVYFNQGDRDPAAKAVEWWEQSPGHRRNMASKDVTQIGVGAARSKSGKWYFCQVFGRPR